MNSQVQVLKSHSQCRLHRWTVDHEAVMNYRFVSGTCTYKILCNIHDTLFRMWLID